MYFQLHPHMEFDGKVVVDIFKRIAPHKEIVDNYTFLNQFTVEDQGTPESVAYELYDDSEYHWIILLINNIINVRKEWPLSVQELGEFVTLKYEGVGAVSSSDITGIFEIGDYVIGKQSGATGQVIGIYPSQKWVQIKPINGVFRENGEDVVRGTVVTVDAPEITATSIKEAVYAPHHFEDMDGNIIDGVSLGTDFSFTNFEYEEQLNEQKAQITVLKPEHLLPFVKNFKSLIIRR